MPDDFASRLRGYMGLFALIPPPAVVRAHVRHLAEEEKHAAHLAIIYGVAFTEAREVLRTLYKARNSTAYPADLDEVERVASRAITHALQRNLSPQSVADEWAASIRAGVLK